MDWHVALGRERARVIPALLVMAGQQAALTAPTGLVANIVGANWVLSWTNSVPTASTVLVGSVEGAAVTFETAVPGQTASTASLPVHAGPLHLHYTARAKHAKGTRASAETATVVFGG